MLENGEFCFLHAASEHGKAAQWSGHGWPLLWAYHLHYCDFLNVDLTHDSNYNLLARATSLMLDWCQRNPPGNRIGWEPYPLSLRIVNWLKFLVRNISRLEAVGKGHTVSQILLSLCEQTKWLERRLEFHLRGNHLLKNAKALLFAGTLLETRESGHWRKTGSQLLRKQLAVQILTDGGHFERSPMYHAQSFEDLLDLLTLYAAFRPLVPLRHRLSEMSAAMAGFLRTILHPDSEIPLFNDSTFGDARPATELLARAEPFSSLAGTEDREIQVLPQTGFGVLRDSSSRSSLIFDCGPIGPDEQPGHGHCDALSYELSLNGERVVVDTGVSTYEAGPVRHYERSTAAHNTVRVDGEEQAEIWAAFRIGRRYSTCPLKSGSAQRFSFLSGEHDGYRRLGVIHSRQIVRGAGDLWIVADHLRGAGTHRTESFIHFHPAIRVEPCGLGEDPVPGGWRKRVVLTTTRRRYFLISPTVGSFAIKQAWYSPEFGRREKQCVGFWVWEGRLPVCLCYAFLPADRPLPEISLSSVGNALRIGNTIVPLC